MEIIEVFFEENHRVSGTVEVATADWYHQPAILESIAFQLQFYYNCKIAIITSSKYGCRQFLPVFRKKFPVHGFIKLDYKQGLDWLVPEFNIGAMEFHPKEFSVADKDL